MNARTVPSRFDKRTTREWTNKPRGNELGEYRLHTSHVLGHTDSDPVTEEGNNRRSREWGEQGSGYVQNNRQRALTQRARETHNDVQQEAFPAGKITFNDLKILPEIKEGTAPGTLFTARPKQRPRPAANTENKLNLKRLITHDTMFCIYNDRTELFGKLHCTLEGFSRNRCSNSASTR